MAEKNLREAAGGVEKTAKTAKKNAKTAKKRLKRENFIFLVSSKFSLYFFTPRGP